MAWCKSVALAVAASALIALAAAAPRNEDRVFYPADGGLSRPTEGRKAPMPVPPQTEAEIEEESNNHISTHQHTEKHIFSEHALNPNQSINQNTDNIVPNSISNSEENSNHAPANDGNPNVLQEENFVSNAFVPQSTDNITPVQDSLNTGNSQPHLSMENANSANAFSKENLSPNNAQLESGISQHSDGGASDPNYEPREHELQSPAQSNPNSQVPSEYLNDPYLNNAPLKSHDKPTQMDSSIEPERNHWPNQPNVPVMQVKDFENSEQYLNMKPLTQESTASNEQTVSDTNIAIPSSQQTLLDYNTETMKHNKKPENHPDANTEQGLSGPKPEDMTHNQPSQSNVYDHNNNEAVDPNSGVPKEQAVRYDGSQLWKIPIDDNHKLRVISGLSAHHVITTWGGNRSVVDVLISPKYLSNVTTTLARSGIPYQVLIQDLQKAIDEENPPLDEEQMELQNRKGHRLTWVQYHKTDDIHGFLDYLADTYPRICSVRSIGKSYEGRDLKMLKISNGNCNNKAAFIDGGIHAREWIAPATVTYIINHIVENYENGPEIYRKLDWYFLPVLNPDGYEFTHKINRLWRKNRRGYGVCVGVDLNRNFGFEWGGKGTSSSPCSDVYRGPYAFSEPESQALRDFLMEKRAYFKLYVSYHSYGQFILHPWGYEEAVPVDYMDLKIAGDRAAQAIQNTDGTRYTVGASSLVLYASAGGSDDWAKAIPGIKYSYTIELPDTGKHGFLLPANNILRVGKESLEGLKKLAEAAASA